MDVYSILFGALAMALVLGGLIFIQYLALTSAKRADVRAIESDESHIIDGKYLVIDDGKP